MMGSPLPPEDAPATGVYVEHRPAAESPAARPRLRRLGTRRECEHRRPHPSKTHLEGWVFPVCAIEVKFGGFSNRSWRGIGPGRRTHPDGAGLWDLSGNGW